MKKNKRIKFKVGEAGGHSERDGPGLAGVLLRDREGLCRGELQGLGLQYKKVQLFKQCIALKGFVEQQVKN